MEWILFDKDGTLIEFDKSWEKIGVRLVDSFLDKFPIADKEAAHRQLGVIDDAIVPNSVMGSGSLDDMVKAFNNIAGEDVSDWTRNTSQELVDNRVPENNWIEGVYETIKSLKNEGYKIGIVTSDSRKGVMQFLEDTNSEDAFDLIISTETHAAEKPNPAVLNPLFDHYDVRPAEVVIVGDTNNDMKTKVNAELGLAIGVLSGIAKKDELEDADYIIDTAVDVPKILKQHNEK
ncbi:HAD family hydrolase [Staphylococcus petrasii]|uniref:HAD family hydrolase n=1 Tax=Staphylococcus petrasii TaxID=1276936 RepID=UPI001F56F345|nr:HAD family hydrolase [Staphylococcus petrasii]MCI2775185.1 HAD family hydrolase [Staphylococcus petrasii]